MTGDGRDMYPGQHELPASEPGIEHVLRALTAEGDATELVGRQAALTMFRSARAQAATQGVAERGWAPQDNPTVPLPARGSPAGQPRPAAPRATRRPRRFSLAAGIAVGLAGACAGMAVAAYAAVLPTPVQNIAHSVFAPLGVPSAAPTPISPTGLGPGSSTSSPSVPGPGTGGGTPPASGTATSPVAASATPGSAGAGGASVSMTVASTSVSFGGRVVFTGHVLRKGQAADLVRVRLLAQFSTGDGTWRVVASGLTDSSGTVVLTGPRMPGNAVFVLDGTGKLAGVASAPASVTVSPLVAVRVSALDVLTVTVWPARDGDPATLEMLQGGTWQVVAGLQLTAHRATYHVTPGLTYRVVVPATATHEAGASPSVTVPTGAATAPTASATATASAATTRRATPSGQATA